MSLPCSYSSSDLKTRKVQSPCHCPHYATWNDSELYFQFHLLLLFFQSPQKTIIFTISTIMDKNISSLKPLHLQILMFVSGVFSLNNWMCFFFHFIQVVLSSHCQSTSLNKTVENRTFIFIITNTVRSHVVGLFHLLNMNLLSSFLQHLLTRFKVYWPIEDTVYTSWNNEPINQWIVSISIFAQI